MRHSTCFPSRSAARCNKEADQRRRSSRRHRYRPGHRHCHRHRRHRSSVFLLGQLQGAIKKQIKGGVRVVVIGISKAPFNAAPKGLNKFYQKILYLPRPDYGSRWSRLTVCTFFRLCLLPSAFCLLLSAFYPGLDPPIGKIGKCLGPRALGGPASPPGALFRPSLAF